ncbi:uncharacterized protein LOC131224207 [Magnolia sinica]|uniref:uncharacterized protein LOC131224207 n=1 Tax=Magnolia sinica TaxID=86752 RepID=UPI0026584A7C|nr:uncharacterized protein LOC131224207 [Magnolia sinica]
MGSTMVLAVDSSPFTYRLAVLEHGRVSTLDLGPRWNLLAGGWDLLVPVFLISGKYYLVDAGFANAPGFLTPFRGIRYHLKEFRQGCQPRTKEELFNLCHSSLRNAIERAFGVLKTRFPILKIASGYPLNTQVNIVAACCILHNHITNEKRDQELDFENNNDIGDGEDESEMHEDEGNESSEEENECDFRNESAVARTEKQRWREF